jgi:hypothetical protein
MGKMGSEIISSRMSDISVYTEMKVCQPVTKYEEKHHEGAAVCNTAGFW